MIHSSSAKRFHLALRSTLFLMMLVNANSSGMADDSLASAAETRDWDQVSRSLDQPDINVDLPQPDGMTAIHWAVYHNHSPTIERLIDAKCDVNATTRYQITPLSIACTHIETLAVELLLDAGADTKAKSPGGETPLFIAARTGNVESIDRLLKHGAAIKATDKRGQTALMWAADAGNVDAVNKLVNAGADLNAESAAQFTAMMFAAREGRIEVVKRLIAAGVDVNEAIETKRKGERAARNGTSALIFAVESGHYQLAMELVAAGADPNDQRNGFTALHVVSWVRKPNSGDDPSGDPSPRGSGNLTDLQFVRDIVAAGADVNRKLESGNGGPHVFTPRGGTPMLYASRTADLPLMKSLVELGADPLIANVDGCTPLMACAGVGVRAVNEEAGTEPEVIEAINYLVELGADVNTVDDNQETAMHGAAYRNFPLVVKSLAAHGADSRTWDHKNKSGWTPVTIAQGHRPGSFKPSPKTVNALRAAMNSADASE